MKEKGVNIEGVKMLETSDGSFIPEDLKHKLSNRGIETGICFYKVDKFFN